MASRPRSRRLIVALVLLVLGLGVPSAWVRAHSAQNKGKEDRKQQVAEWKEIQKTHPQFAKAILADEVILMGNENPRIRMDKCKMIAMGLILPFSDFWEQLCATKVPPIDPGGVLGCLEKNKGDPAACFSINHEDEWFQDPRKTGLPPRPPDPHQR